MVDESHSNALMALHSMRGAAAHNRNDEPDVTITQQLAKARAATDDSNLLISPDKRLNMLARNHEEQDEDENVVEATEEAEVAESYRSRGDVE